MWPSMYCYTVIGLLETHGRAETAALADGLRDLSSSRGGLPRHDRLQEWTCPAILRACAAAGRIDELAHTNAPGARARQALRGRRGRARRRASTCSRRSTCSTWSPSTTNSPSTAACACAKPCPTRRSSAPTRSSSSTSPPRRCSSACARAGSTPAERIDAALNGFFRIENLTVLRETALRQVAEEVVSKRSSHLPHGAPPSASGCSRSCNRSRAPSGWFAARGARPSASAPISTSCGCSRPVARPTTRPRALSSALRQLISGSGPTSWSVSPTTWSKPPRRRSAERGTTYVLLGESPPRRGLGRLREPLPQRIMRAAPRGVDVRIVAARREK